MHSSGSRLAPAVPGVAQRGVGRGSWAEEFVAGRLRSAWTASGRAKERPRRVELPWGAEESNRFGIDELVEYCREPGAEPYV
jgi:hypothetical protein